jgi:hypothetical protein
MVEIAICVAIIGIALISIIGVLPIGMNTQRDNREETIINQDVTILLEAIRGGARGMDDLTNYVYGITNYWAQFDSSGALIRTNVSGYGYAGSSLNGVPMAVQFPITNGFRIVGLLSTPEYSDVNGRPIFSITNSTDYISNHIVAYVHSISGPAIEKPLQDNDIVREDSFGYRLLCINSPIPSHTPPLWVAQAYNEGDNVTYLFNGQYSYWRAVFGGQPSLPPRAADVPGNSVRWVRDLYAQQLAANLHELRMTFFWPQQPNGSVGPGRQSFRTLIAGQLTRDPIATNLYYYSSQSFINVINVTNAP